MKRMNLFVTVLVAVLIASIALPAIAGAGPIKRGGVHTKAAARSAIMYNSRVKKSYNLLAQKYHFPSGTWAKLQGEAKANRVHGCTFSSKKRTQSYCTAGHVGLTSRSTVKGSAYYVDYKTVTCTKTEQITTVCKFYLRKSCANSLASKTVTKKRLYEVTVSKFLDTGERARKHITGTVGTKKIDVYTSTTCNTHLANVLCGTKVDLHEDLDASSTPVSPSNGHFTGKVAKCNLNVKFVNHMIVCPPPAAHQLLITAEYREFTCESTVTAYAVLGADTLVHTDNDQIVLYKWHYDGHEYLTTVDFLIVNPPYGQAIIADVTATDAAGHVSNTAEFVPRNPGSPPGTPEN